MADRSSFPSEQADKFLVRLPDGMRDRIAEAAKASGRSMNAEIIARLAYSFDAPREESIEFLTGFRDLISHLKLRIDEFAGKDIPEPLESFAQAVKKGVDAVDRKAQERRSAETASAEAEPKRKPRRKPPT